MPRKLHPSYALGGDELAIYFDFNIFFDYLNSSNTLRYNTVAPRTKSRLPIIFFQIMFILFFDKS
jgi:hypothetical protein